MLKKFRNHIETHFPFLTGTKLLVACSGGLDSTVLVHLTFKIGLDIAIAHCNFNLRGEESDGDEAFAKNMAQEMNLEFHSKSFDTIDQVDKIGGSIQMIARDLRYQWFQELTKSKGYDYILTAHHADDAMETFLINLSRGTGIKGLTGIPMQNDKVIRPLLSFPKSELFEFAQNHWLKWREDGSNKDTKYLRNQIRHEVVPALRKLHPTFSENFKNTQIRLRGSATILENLKRELQSKLFHRIGDQIRIPIEEIQRLNPLQEYLYLLFSEFGFTAWEDMARLITAMSGKKITSRTHVLLKDRVFLVLSELSNTQNESYALKEGQVQIEHPISLKLEMVKTRGAHAKNILYADKEKLNYPLKLRKWQNGDYFYPLGMKGKKKLSKFFKDEKVDLIAKRAQWLLCSDEDIVWLLGRRADERFKVTENTKNILKITWLD